MKIQTANCQVLPLWASLFRLALVSCEDDTPPIISTTETVVLPLKSLPELYSDQKLPRAPPEDGTRCYPLLGCIEPQPGGIKPQEPLAMYAEFNLYGENDSVILDYKPTRACLENYEACELYPYDLKAMLESTYNPNNPTIFVTRGYFTKDMASWQYRIRDLWKRWANVNVVLVRWPGGNGGYYPQAVANTKIVARQLSVFLYYVATLNNLKLTDQNFLSKVYLIGHSLGAHISGFVGKDMDGKIGRIIGLDPAGPLFSEVDKIYRLDKEDAQLVEAIHTNGGHLSTTQHHYGLFAPLGHLDYYANDGKHQPGCAFGKDIIGCSHKLAPHYFLDFLEYQVKARDDFGSENVKVNRLLAFRAESFEEFEKGSSFLDRCPKSVLDDPSDLADLNRCSIPMDFFASPDERRTELKHFYDIDLYQKDPTPYTAYFYTSSEIPYVGVHSIMRVKVRNLSNGESSIKCNLRFNFKMETGQHSKRDIKDYNIVSDEIVLPYLTFSPNYPQELSRLDRNDFFLESHDSKEQLSLGIKRTFAHSIQISGLRLETSGSQSPVMKRMKELFAIVHISTDDLLTQCDYLIESIRSQPLKILRRSFVASYSVNAGAGEDCHVIVSDRMKDVADTNVIDELTELPKVNRTTPEVFIDTVYLGMRNEV